MKMRSNDWLMQNKIFGWLALATGLLLLIPLLGSYAMGNWNWGIEDFIFATLMLFGTGSVFILVARRVRNTTHRVLIGGALLIAFLLIWIEAAVGIFD